MAMAAELAPGSFCVAAKLQVREPTTGSSSALRGFCSFRTLRGLQFAGKLESFSKDSVRPVLVAAARGRGGAKPARIDGVSVRRGFSRQLYTLNYIGMHILRIMEVALEILVTPRRNV